MNVRIDLANNSIYEMINCHLCDKTVILLTSHLQKTHKWSKKESKDFQKSALHAFKKIAKSGSGKRSTTDMSNEMSTTTTSHQSKSSFAFNDSSQAMIEPRRKLSWTEMDRLDDEDGECKGENAANDDSKNGDIAHNIIEAYLNEVVNHLDKTYGNLHHTLADLVCDGRSGDRDIVDGNMDVSVYLQTILKPSLRHLCEESALEMRRMCVVLKNGGYLRQ